MGLLDIVRPVRLRGRAAETVAWFAFGGERDDWAAPEGPSPVLWLLQTAHRLFKIRIAEQKRDIARQRWWLKGVCTEAGHG